MLYQTELPPCDGRDLNPRPRNHVVPSAFVADEDETVDYFKTLSSRAQRGTCFFNGIHRQMKQVPRCARDDNVKNAFWSRAPLVRGAAKPRGSEVHRRGPRNADLSIATNLVPSPRLMRMNRRRDGNVKSESWDFHAQHGNGDGPAG